MFSISTNQDGRVEHVYGPNSPDDAGQRYEITEDEFILIAERGRNGDFVFQNGQLQLSPPPPSNEQLRAKAKVARAAAVASLTVTTSTGKTFDGNEDARNRMTSAIVVAQLAGITSTAWTLADNTNATVTLAELSEALILAGQQQSAVWPISI